MAYDQQNIFAKILRGEIPCAKVYEDDYVLAFDDIAPQAPVHTLVIPKGPYQSINEISAEGKTEELAALLKALGTVAEIKGVKETGYRVITNTGSDAAQDVPHLHFHILGGRRLVGAIIKPVA
jgi:diadenosine tetraphosphate (Ap4A) HIT family hydrolase